MKTRTLTALLFTAPLVGGLMLAGTVPLAGADKETRQMMADIRILQEQSQQLQNLIASLNASLNDAIKAVNGRLEDQTNSSRKSLADQKLVIDAMANDLRALREKVDDNNVRVGSLGQELDSLRQLVTAINAPRPFGSDADSVTPAETAANPSAAGAVGASPQKLFDAARGDYWAGQYDLAAQGFLSYLEQFPQSPQAPDAQMLVGHSYLNAGKYDKAVEAYDAVIRNYPRSSEAPEAYAKKGLALMDLKQYDKAREALEYVIKNYPADNAAVVYAQQRLKDLPAVAAPKR